MKDVIVISPHPDDETLGCGGTLLKHKDQGDRIHWLNVSGIHKSEGYSEDQIQTRASEMEQVCSSYGFSSFHNLMLKTALLDAIPIGDIIGLIAEVFQTIKPNIVYLPFPGDIHTDHQVVYKAASSCTKWFRFPYIERVLLYEVLSETDFQLSSNTGNFSPNVFIDIERYLDTKCSIVHTYSTEIGDFPFPRSEKAIRALAHIRGVASGFNAAESFMLVRDRMF